MTHSRAAIQYNRARPLTSTQWEAVQLFLDVDVDGVPGPNTGEAITTWQRQNGLEVDGMLGPSTLAAMVTAGLDVVLEPRQIPDLERWQHSKVVELDSALGYLGGMAIDCDGSPTAYRPDNKGTDYLANAGWRKDPATGQWGGKGWGLHLRNGKPVKFPSDHPHAGNYVSSTALSNQAEPPASRYVDADAIPYVALPSNFRREWCGDRALTKGDLVLVGREGDVPVWAIYADVAPRWTANKAKNHVMGEGSPRLAVRLGHNPFVQRRGVTRALRSIPAGVVYLVFPGTAQLLPAWPGHADPRWPYTEEMIEAAGMALLESRGTSAEVEIDRVRELLAR